jgi:hypothetical protein
MARNVQASSGHILLRDREAATVCQMNSLHIRPSSSAKADDPVFQSGCDGIDNRSVLDTAGYDGSLRGGAVQILHLTPA